MAFSLTDEQQDVVDNRGGGLLVSAAAGSGKTRVLVERLVDRVEQEGLDVDRFLVITYTRAAAAELRGRIVEELTERLARSPEDGHLRRQATLVYKAQISTIHALCAQILREQGHLLDLEPDFRLLDEGEAGLLMQDALTDVLERRYETIQEGDDFSLLVDTMSAGRDDSKLEQIVLDVRGRVQSHPDPAAWLNKQEQTFALEGVTDAGETVWGRLLLKDAARQARYWAGQMARALDLCECDDTFAANYAPSLSATLDGLNGFVKAAETGWDAACAALPIPFPTPGRKRVSGGCAEMDQVKDLRTRCKKRMEKLAEGFQDSSADLLEDLRAVYPAVKALFDLVRDFEAAYTAEKQRRGVLDFSDLEHLTVRLLAGPEGPTELARQLSGRYDEIMVDEFQDTNAVQNAICTALSRDGKNLFMVGDVKQSIYRFRLADPTIFLEKYRTFRPYKEAKEGEERRITLSRNFRSRPEVLEGANYLFRGLMSEEFGEMDYTDDQALYPGRKVDEPLDPRYAVELSALDLSDEAEDEGEKSKEEQAAKVPKDLQEARFAALRIRQLLDEGFPIPENGEDRPVTEGDIVILLRSPGTVLHHYARALGERGIPWEAEGGSDFFASTEVHVALSLLQVVDNPRQDVPLIAVLRSPVYGFTADQLAAIRAGHKDLDYFGAVEAAAQEGDSACAEFLAELSALRFGAGDLSCYQLLWKLYDGANLMGVFGAMSDGEERQANLHLLADLARRFEGAGHKGLFGFLSYLSGLQARGERIAAPAAGGGSGVRILSIHRSKGLEFPVVLLCGLSRRLNREDVQRPILFHPKLGVGPKRLDLSRGVEYPTLARRAVARQLEYEMMAEELRLLYVAMTRAREKLILSVALTGGGKDIAKLLPDAGCPAAPQALADCASVGQWVLLPVLCRKEAAPLRDAALGSAPPSFVDPGPQWDIRWVKGTTLAAPPRRRAAEEEAARGTVDRELLRRLSWTYPHEADVAIPSKITATQLKGRERDKEAADQAGNGTAVTSTPDLRRPRFAQEEQGLTPAQQGSALHLALQYLDFQQTKTTAEIKAEVQRLVDRAFLTPEQGTAVDPRPIAAFFASPLGKEVREAPDLRREFKFSLLTPARRVWPEAGEGEEVLLQGVVDLFFETLEGITVVDFKTDRVSEQTVLARAEEYRAQMETYSGALEQIFGKKVVRRVLWFFALGQGVEV